MASVIASLYKAQVLTLFWCFCRTRVTSVCFLFINVFIDPICASRIPYVKHLYCLPGSSPYTLTLRLAKAILHAIRTCLSGAPAQLLAIEFFTKAYTSVAS